MWRYRGQNASQEFYWYADYVSSVLLATLVALKIINDLLIFTGVCIVESNGKNSIILPVKLLAYPVEKVVLVKMAVHNLSTVSRKCYN